MLDERRCHYLKSSLKENKMAYKINARLCIKCGICVQRCPEKAFIPLKPSREPGGLILQPVKIDPEKCNDCGVCLSEEWWCPGKAISKA
jgi:NAD-dependent dihydropyrimidine dehydrogenase PreA subunit